MFVVFFVLFCESKNGNGSRNGLPNECEDFSNSESLEPGNPAKLGEEVVFFSQGNNLRDLIYI